jgi:hypothetical protein
MEGQKNYYSPRTMAKEMRREGRTERLMGEETIL